MAHIEDQSASNPFTSFVAVDCPRSLQSFPPNRALAQVRQRRHRTLRHASGIANERPLLFTIYSKWIDGADRMRGKVKMEALLLQDSMPNETSGKFTGSSPGEPNFIGRRDWTRTNDPHHVKVVL